MQDLLLLMQGFHLSFQALHTVYHAIEGRKGLRGFLAGEGGVGGEFEGGEDDIPFTLEVFLNSFEILARELVREAEKGLILCNQVAY